MKMPRDLSGRAVVDVLVREFDYRVVRHKQIRKDRIAALLM